MSDSSRSVNVLRFSPDGAYLLSGGVDGCIRLWRVEDAKELRRFQGHQAPVSAFAFSQDGHQVLSGSRGGRVRLWDVERGKELCRFDERTRIVDGVTFLRPTTAFLSVADDGDHLELRRCDLETGRIVHSAPLRTEVAGLQLSGIAFSRDGRRALTGTEHDGIRQRGAEHFAVRFWDTQTGAELACLTGHSADVTSVAISANGRLGLSGSEDRTVRFWRLPK
jgi:WD40 repeat protein